MERAKANPQRIVLPEGTEPRTLQAADIILQEKAARLILIGNEAEIRRLAEEKGLKHLGEATIFDPTPTRRWPNMPTCCTNCARTRA